LAPFSYKKAKVTDLIPYANNARTHSAAQIDKIAASMREFGFINPVIVDGDNGIIAGHGRVLAAIKLGMDDVPTLEASHLTDTQKRAYVLADNRLALDAGWDNSVLVMELTDLQAVDFDVSLTGFSLDEVGDLINGPMFEPGTEDDQGRLDQLSPKMVTCPHCGGEWDLREHGEG
jgi:ParB family transcriptional regulator, chromosome partitioning protein